MVSTWPMIWASVKWLMVMASKRHSAAQVPQPAQAAELTTAGFLALTSTVMALYGQTSAHLPQALHFSVMITEVIGSVVTVPLCISRMARMAAAEAWVTLSLMSLGPSAQPA